MIYKGYTRDAQDDAQNNGEGLIEDAAGVCLVFLTGAFLCVNQTRGLDLETANAFFRVKIFWEMHQIVDYIGKSKMTCNI